MRVPGVHFRVAISNRWPIHLHEARTGFNQAPRKQQALAEGGAPVALTNFVGFLAEVESLAREYQHRLGLPPAARLDVLHLACAVVHELDYLLTWNCAHLANGRVTLRLHAVNARLGRRTPLILTPEELLRVPGGE